MPETNKIADAVERIAKKGFTHKFGKPEIEVKNNPAWQQLRELGTKLWLDTGDINVASDLWCSQFEALTTNNSLLNKEVQKGIYDDLIKTVASEIKNSSPDIDQKGLLLEIAFVLNAYHALRLVEVFDANVSVELHTDLGNNVERSVEYALRFYRICPERFYIKVPLTPAGLLAARKLSQQEIPVNLTLGFSARQNYVATQLAQPNYVNVFMGRLNAFVANNGLGDGINVGEKATLATQKHLLQLRKEGKTKSLLIGASMRGASQVVSLAGLDVFTMPPKVAADYNENPSDSVTSAIKNDPVVSLSEGVKFEDFNATTLWDVPEEFKACVDALLKKNIDGLTPSDIQSHFADAGLGDLFPKWTNEDIQTITADGKIPVYDKWKDKLSTGQIGLDTLMNISAFYSFATDQKALDERTKSLL